MWTIIGIGLLILNHLIAYVLTKNNLILPIYGLSELYYILLISAGIIELLICIAIGKMNPMQPEKEKLENKKEP